MSCRKKSMSKSERIGFVGVGLMIRGRSHGIVPSWKTASPGSLLV